MFQSKIMKDKVEQAVYEKQVGMIYQSLPVSLITTAIVVCLLLVFLHGAIPSPVLTLWTTLMGVVICARFATAGFYFYIKKQGRVNAVLFEILFLVGVALAASCWGSAGIWLYKFADPGSRFLIIVVLVGMAAGSIGLLSYRFLAFLLFITFILFPLMVGVNLAGETQRVSISLAIITYYFFLLASARRFSNNTKEMFSLQEEAVSREARLQRAKEEAERSSRAKSEFLANISHEIRTPMNSIIGLNRILAMESHLTPKQLYYLQTIQNSADSLLALLNDVLDLAKVEAGQLELDMHPFVLQNVVEEAVHTVEAMADEKSLDLSCHVDSDAPTLVRGDSLRLRQVLLNLLSNAVKFTENGRVDLRVITEDPGRGAFTFQIEDTGIGIASDVIDKIFGNFSQADSSVTRKYGGSGMGLAICRKLVSLMGGEVEVRSVLGKGTIFQIHLVLPPVWEEEIAGRKEADSEKAGRVTGLEILLVEDNKVNRDVARLFLQHDQHKITEAFNGFHALQLLAEKEFDIVLMDIQMPVMDGLETAEIIRSFERGESTESTDLPSGLGARFAGKHLPIIALTAHALKGDKNQCLESGMDAYLSKPLQPEQLAAVLAKYAGGGKQTEPGGDQQEAAELAADSLKQKITHHLSETYHIGPDKIGELVSSSLVTLAEQIAACRADIENNDLASLEKSAHTLKGSLVNIGFSGLGAQMAKLEKDAGQGIESDYFHEIDKLEEELAELFT